jgi:hypothetical protein
VRRSLCCCLCHRGHLLLRCSCHSKGSPPILFMPGCGYFCAQPCLKTYILSMASPEVAKVTMNRNTRRVALIHATKAKEIDKVMHNAIVMR